MSDSYRPNKEKYSLKNPFKKSHNNKTPEGEPLENVGSGSFLGSKKLLIITAIATFIVIIIVMSESVVIYKQDIEELYYTLVQ